MAAGILMITLAATAFRSREPTAVFGAILGGAASIGTMTAVNFAINSDFRWALLGLFALWAASLIAYWLEGAKARRNCVLGESTESSLPQLFKPPFLCSSPHSDGKPLHTTPCPRHAHNPRRIERRFRHTHGRRACDALNQ